MSNKIKIYLHGARPDIKTATFTKLKEHLILNIKSEFLNGSDIAESICKGEILDLSREITVERILTEYEVIREESKNKSFRSMWNIKSDNQVKIENKLEEKKKAYVVVQVRFKI